MKRTVPVLIACVTGLVLVVAFFSPQSEASSEAAVTWFNILAAIAFVLGGGNLLKVQLETISARRPGWGYAAVVLVSFVATLAFGLLKVGVPPAPQYPAHAWSGQYDAPQTPFGWIFEYVLTPLTATMFASLAFYVASAAFRAFRAKNVEAILLLGTAFLVLLGRTAVANLTEGLPPALQLENIVAWIMSYISTAGTRAITIGIAVGVAATSLRVLLGIDRPYLGRSAS
jgi:hypothetical protein